MEKPIELEEVKISRREIIRDGTPLWHAIVKDLQAGMSRTSVARKHDIQPKVVDRIAYQTGLRRDETLPGDTPTSAAHRARHTYAKDRRIQLIDKLFEKAEDMLNDICDPAELDKLISGIARLIDKRRLEDGEATSRTETATTIAKESLETKLDDLAKRREDKRLREAQAAKTKASKEAEIASRLEKAE